MARTPSSKKTPAKSKATPKSAMSTETQLVRDLANILKNTNLTEIEVEKGTLRVRVARETYTVAAAPVAAAPVAIAAAPVPAAAAAPAASSEPDHKNAMKSPMVGTAYVRPSPEAEPFVKVGDMVKAGSTIILIEAMKTFNPIAAEKTGKLTALFVDDAQPVEFGEPLFVIE